MKITPRGNGVPGATVTGFVLGEASTTDLAELRSAIYREKILLLPEQQLTPERFVAFGRALGLVETYYEPMYHHPEHREIFVSASTPEDGPQVGVPETGKFWHADYSYMPVPFGITMIHQQVVPAQDAGTYFIDMGKAFRTLPEKLKEAARQTSALHSPRRYFKIRPDDVYRPMIEVQQEIEKTTPPAIHPTVISHPVTAEDVLYISEGFTCELHDEDGRVLDGALLGQLLDATGQLDPTFTHPGIHRQRFTAGDLLIWDNRSLVHHVLHTTEPEPEVWHRVTVHDEHPFHLD
jgi:(R)-3-[(carboxymethyl)amino]fatty acid dioxygenase/decarboxylase